MPLECSQTKTGRDYWILIRRGRHMARTKVSTPIIM
jgi:hypothetical protein